MTIATVSVRKVLLSSLALSVLALPVLAEDNPARLGGPEGHGPRGMEKMLNADTDGDGMLSKAEFMAVHEKRFDEMDSNHDGKVSKDEMKAHREAMKAEFEAKRKEWESKRKEGESK